jgi:ABC-type transport system substrate-binding protein
MNALDILKYGHRTVCRVIDGLPEPDWETGGVCGYWSVKDIIGHLAAFEHVLTDVLSSFLDGGETPYLDQMRASPMAFNDTEADKRKDKPAADVLAEYNDTQAQTMVLARRIPAETWTAVGTLPWYGKEYSLDDYIVYAYYGHKREHSAQIAVFRDGLK